MFYIAAVLHKVHVHFCPGTIRTNLFKIINSALCPENVKGKAIPLQAWTGPVGSRRVRLPDFKTIGT